MANEVVARHGISISGKTYISTVDLNVNANSVLVLNGSEVQYRDVSSLPDTFVTGGTYSDGTATFTNNTGGTFNISGFFTSANTINIYNTDSTLSSDRTVTQDGNNLLFDSLTSEWSQFSHDNSSVVNNPRLRVQANNPYDTVMELESASPGVFLIQGIDSNTAPVFSVDGVGNLVATSKSFLIKHPIKEDYALRYGSLEGPEHGVYVRGRLNGTNTIELPDYWVELIDESTITVQLTSIGKHQNLYVKDIVDNTIVVANGNILSSKINCFYFVQAERKDIEKMVVEFPRGTEPLQ